MSFIQKILDKSGLSFIFKPPIDEEEERLQTLEWINQFIASIIEHVEKDIETEKFGFYPHPENQQALNEKADSLGYIQYTIKDKTGKRLELSQLNLVSCNSIKMTENYKALKKIVDDAGYTIELKEIDIDADGVETYEEIDEYIDLFERYYVITLSGWN